MTNTIFEYQKMVRESEQARRAGRVVVLATGVFDILHSEHELFLQAARRAGDILFVGLETDGRVRQMKGEGRPVNPLEKRLQNLAELKIADAVFSLPEQFQTNAERQKLIEDIHPDILAVSAHSPHLDKKRQLLAKVGGEVRVVRPHNPNVSTTKILEQQKQTA